MLNVGLIGFGGWGKRLVESVQGKSKTVRFVSAVTGTPAKHEDFVAKHGLKVEADLKAMLADPKVQAVVSTASVGLHAPHSLAALEAGKPVLAVKPMAVTRKEAEALAAASAKSGALLAMGYNRCFYPSVAELRKRLAAGALGKTLHIEGNFCVDRYGKLKVGDWKTDESQVIPGALADHMLYAAVEIMGEVAEVQVQASKRAANLPIADTVGVLLKFKSGASGLLTAIGTTATYERLTVFGDKGWAEIRNGNRFEFQPTAGKGEVIDFPEFDAERAEMEGFAAAVAGETKFPVPVSDAVHGVAVIEAMGKSAKTGKPAVP
jgi:predicted dehydrogenase